MIDEHGVTSRYVLTCPTRQTGWFEDDEIHHSPFSSCSTIHQSLCQHALGSNEWDIFLSDAKAGVKQGGYKQ